MAGFLRGGRLMSTSFKVKIWKTDVYEGKRGNTYYVRWEVEKKRFKEPYKSAGLADSFRSQLVAAAKSGDAFSVETGRPTSMTRAANTASWFTFACSYADMKWPES